MTYIGKGKNPFRYGGLAQLARAPALQAGGQRFESVILHNEDLKRDFRSTLTYWNTEKIQKRATLLVIAVSDNEEDQRKGKQKGEKGT